MQTVTKIFILSQSTWDSSDIRRSILSYDILYAHTRQRPKISRHRQDSSSYKNLLNSLNTNWKPYKDDILIRTHILHFASIRNEKKNNMSLFRRFTQEKIPNMECVKPKCQLEQEQTTNVKFNQEEKNIRK